MRVPILLTTYCLIASPTFADGTDVAKDLGPVLAAEEPCGFRYDGDAIRAYIEKNVAADDMQFARNLDYQTWTGSNSIQQMSGSSKLAYCIQEGRVAKTYGFLK